MASIDFYEASDFNERQIEYNKGNKKIYVIFSTLGEREASLLYEKIVLIDQLDFVDTIIVSHRRLNGDREDITEQRAKTASKKVHIVPCNTVKVPDMGAEKGKGADMRRTLYYLITQLNADIENTIVVFLDADVHTQYFGKHFVIGLSGPVVDGYDFAKASFWREMGRVKKFVAQPLFSVIAHDSLEPLQKLAYPLSGEIAGTLSFFTKVNFYQMYGVETAINIYAVLGNFRIADVNLGLYDHEHRSELDIQKMAFGIIRTFFLELIETGYIELKKGASISNLFRAQYIDQNSKRQSLEFDLHEKKYNPLYTII